MRQVPTDSKVGIGHVLQRGNTYIGLGTVQGTTNFLDTAIGASIAGVAVATRRRKDGREKGDERDERQTHG